MWTTRYGNIWTLRSGSAEHQDRVFARPLGTLERAYYWDGALDGVSDTVVHQVVELSQNASLAFNPDAAHAAWLALKRRLPIISATTQPGTAEQSFEFVVDEARVNAIGVGEVEWIEGGATTASSALYTAMTGPRQLSEQKLASITLMHEHGSRSLNIIYRIAHVITDGMGSSTLVRTFLNCLASGPSQLPERDLSDRLAMALSCDFLLPPPTDSPAKQRWRSAVARIIWNRAMAGMRHGQTFPSDATPSTSPTPAKSREILLKLPRSLSRAILRTCRANDVGFGHVLPVVSQLALARFLQRRRAQGRISDAEWEARMRQPTHTLSPSNIRPILDREWLAAGGDHEMNIAFSVFFTSIPYLPSPRPYLHTDVTGAPPMSALLSRKRFFARCKEIKRQMNAWSANPLFYELREEQSRTFEVARGSDAREWRYMQNGGSMPLPVVDNQGGLTLAYSGGSLGDLDKWVPHEYPLPRRQSAATGGTDSPPILRLLRCNTHLRCRPGELHLGASAWCGQMSLYVYYDGNVYQEDDVQQWTQDAKDTLVWYLGGQSRIVDEDSHAGPLLARM